MTIRHKANISQKINDFQIILSKYSNKNQNAKPAQLIKDNKVDVPHSQNYQRNLSARMLDEKEVSIKSIDQRINNIMKKHNGGECPRSPLEPLSNQSNHKKEKSLCQMESIQKSPIFSAKKQGGLKAEHMREERKRLRQRSNRIFQPTERQILNQPKENSKYDQEIKKLNERIKQAQEKKRNLNIEFNPFVASSKSRPKLENLSERARQKPSMTVTPAKQQPKAQQILKKQIVSEFKIQLITPKKQTTQKIGGIIKNKPTTQFALSLNNNDLLKYSSLPSAKTKQKKYIKEVIDAFIEQIDLDQKFRNNKIWFTFSNEENKWLKLEQKLNAKGFLMSSEVCRAKFQSTVEEHNPFYRWQNISFQQGLTELVNSYDKSENYWHINILNRWSKQHLEEEQLKSMIIFEERRDQITLEDLVRWVNTETGKLYRNRDLHILFKRLTAKSNEYVQYQYFVSAIAK